MCDAVTCRWASPALWGFYAAYMYALFLVRGCPMSGGATRLTFAWYACGSVDNSVASQSAQSPDLPGDPGINPAPETLQVWAHIIALDGVLTAAETDGGCVCPNITCPKTGRLKPIAQFLLRLAHAEQPRDPFHSDGAGGAGSPQPALVVTPRAGSLARAMSHLRTPCAASQRCVNRASTGAPGQPGHLQRRQRVVDHVPGSHRPGPTRCAILRCGCASLDPPPRPPATRLKLPLLRSGPCLQARAWGRRRTSGSGRCSSRMSSSSRSSPSARGRRQCPPRCAARAAAFARFPPRVRCITMRRLGSR